VIPDGIGGDQQGGAGSYIPQENQANDSWRHQEIHPGLINQSLTDMHTFIHPSIVLYSHLTM
jgi:hypothetical protein